MKNSYCPQCGAEAQVVLESWELNKLMSANPPMRGDAFPVTCTPCRDKILNKFNDPAMRDK